MRRRPFSLALAVSYGVTTLAACGATGTEPGADVPAVVGAYCATLAPAVARSGDEARVTIYRNTLSYGYVQAGGRSVQQERRGCREASCLYTGVTPAVDDRTLVSTCTASTA